MNVDFVWKKKFLFFRKRLKNIVLVLVLILSSINISKAQTSSVEFWPEIDLWLKLNKQWRLSLFDALSQNIETKYREGNIITQIDYVFGKSHSLHPMRLYDESQSLLIKPFMIRSGYLAGKSLGEEGGDYVEKTCLIEFHLRTPLKGNMIATNRLRTDLRWLGDDTPDFSYRLRYRIMLEKEIFINEISLVPYINCEPYYDSRYEMVNRVRAVGGATISWLNWNAVEANFTYQYDSKSSITNTYAFNLILHIFFVTKKAK